MNLCDKYSIKKTLYIKRHELKGKTTELSTCEISLNKLFTELSTLSTGFIYTKHMFCEINVGNVWKNFCSNFNIEREIKKDLSIERRIIILTDIFNSITFYYLTD